MSSSIDKPEWAAAQKALEDIKQAQKLAAEAKKTKEAPSMNPSGFNYLQALPYALAGQYMYPPYQQTLYNPYYTPAYSSMYPYQMPGITRSDLQPPSLFNETSEPIPTTTVNEVQHDNTNEYSLNAGTAIKKFNIKMLKASVSKTSVSKSSEDKIENIGLITNSSTNGINSTFSETNKFSNDPSAQTTDNYPPALREYVNKCLTILQNEDELNKVKDVIAKAFQDGSVWTKDWTKEPLPCKPIYKPSAMPEDYKSRRGNYMDEDRMVGGDVPRNKKQLYLPSKSDKLPHAYYEELRRKNRWRRNNRGRAYGGFLSTTPVFKKSSLLPYARLSTSRSPSVHTNGSSHVSGSPSSSIRSPRSRSHSSRSYSSLSEGSGGKRKRRHRRSYSRSPSGPRRRNGSGHGFRRPRRQSGRGGRRRNSRGSSISHSYTPSPKGERSRASGSRSPQGWHGARPNSGMHQGRYFSNYNNDYNNQKNASKASLRIMIENRHKANLQNNPVINYEYLKSLANTNKDPDVTIVNDSPPPAEDVDENDDVVENVEEVTKKRKNKKNKKKKNIDASTAKNAMRESQADTSANQELLDKRSNRFKLNEEQESINRRNNKLENGLNNNFMIAKFGIMGFGDNAADSEIIDWTKLHVVGTSTNIERPYLRLTSAPDPELIRPAAVLYKSLLHVQKKWCEEHNYHYVCEQLKSIRQDLVVQNIRDALTVAVYETHCRIALEVADREEFNQCQSQLQALYSDGQTSKFKEEFVAYQIIYHMFTNSSLDLNTSLGSLTPESLANPMIKYVIKLHSAWSLGNYHTFFRYYSRNALRMSAYLIDWFIVRERKLALGKIIKAYKQSKLAISFLVNELAFKDGQECKEFIKSLNLSLTSIDEEDDMFDCKHNNILFADSL